MGKWERQQKSNLFKRGGGDLARSRRVISTIVYQCWIVVGSIYNDLIEVFGEGCLFFLPTEISFTG